MTADRFQHTATRRGVFRLAAAVGFFSFVDKGLAQDPPSLAYMKQVAKDLFAAHRQGTVDSFRRAIQRHADIASIADYSLGQYASRMSAGQKPQYYKGVATFMARYFADESHEYRLAKYTVGDARQDDDGDVLVDTKVYLMSGSTYTVVWRLARRGSGYKVTDAKILGFSLVYLQRGIFQSYLSKRNGDVSQLVAALNR